MRYGMKTKVQGSFDDVKAQLEAALKEQGFGILSNIDVQATLKEKLNEDMERYEILGACNPQLAYKALEADPRIGLLLPCNIVVRELNGSIEVNILDPEVMFSVLDETTKADLLGLPEQAKERLGKALEVLKGIKA